MFAARGFELHAGAAMPVVLDLLLALANASKKRAGVRLRDVDGLDGLLDVRGCIGAIAAGHLRAAARPVRALLFDKSAANNWSLGWHQDRTIAVIDRQDVEGFGPWTIKAGMLHVEPLPALQTAMITLRVHLDAVEPTNAPLLVAPGSHRLGRIQQADIPAVVRRCGIASCVAAAGDIRAYSTPILHASKAAVTSCRRRVLQVDYAIGELPGGLRWLGG